MDCFTCGTQFPPGEQPPETCPICLDERQYVGYNGQQLTTLAKMQNEGFRNEFEEWADPALRFEDFPLG